MIFYCGGAAKKQIELVARAVSDKMVIPSLKSTARADCSCRGDWRRNNVNNGVDIVATKVIEQDSKLDARMCSRQQSIR